MNSRMARINAYALIAILLLSSPPFLAMANTPIEEGKFLATLFVSAELDGKAVQGAEVKVYMLTPHGAKEIARGSLGSFALILPKKYLTEVDGLKVYESVNLRVEVKKGSYYGRATFPLDPTYEYSKVVKVEMIDLKSFNTDSWPPGYVTDSSWEWTEVLRFATWDNIEPKYVYPVGCKIRVESKWRVYPNGPWHSDGYTEVTVERYMASPYLEEKRLYRLFFELYYVDEINPWSYVESVYATNSDNIDPRGFKDTSESWSGVLPGSPYYITTPQNRVSAIEVTGGEDLIFTVSVSFGVTGTSVSLNVGKRPSPSAYLYIRAGTWSPGYVVKTESVEGGSYLYTKSNWVYQP